MGCARFFATKGTYFHTTCNILQKVDFFPLMKIITEKPACCVHWMSNLNAKAQGCRLTSLSVSSPEDQPAKVPCLKKLLCTPQLPQRSRHIGGRAVSCLPSFTQNPRSSYNCSASIHTEKWEPVMARGAARVLYPEEAPSILRRLRGAKAPDSAASVLPRIPH